MKSSRTVPLFVFAAATAVTLLLSFPIFAEYALAQPSPTTIPNPLGKDREFTAIIKTITQWAAAIAVSLTTLMVVIGGYLYMFSGGDPKRITAAHTTLKWAVVGFIITLVATSLTALIERILGVK